jgi:hypothetical protein
MEAFQSSSEGLSNAAIAGESDNDYESSTEASGDDDSNEHVSILEYARTHGLCRNVFLDSPISVVDISRFQSWEPNLDDKIAIEHNTIKPMKHLQQPERLEMKAQSQVLILGIFQDLQSVDVHLDDIEPSRTTRRMINALKMEEPFLKTDHETDVLEFQLGHEARMEQILPRLDSLPFETVNEENDEGFGFPVSMANTHDRVLHSIVHERLEIPISSLQHFKDTVLEDPCSQVLEAPHNVRPQTLKVSHSYLNPHSSI